MEATSLLKKEKIIKKLCVLVGLLFIFTVSGYFFGGVSQAITTPDLEGQGEGDAGEVWEGEVGVVDFQNVTLDTGGLGENPTDHPNDFTLLENQLIGAGDTKLFDIEVFYTEPDKTFSFSANPPPGSGVNISLSSCTTGLNGNCTATGQIQSDSSGGILGVVETSVTISSEGQNATFSIYQVRVPERPEDIPTPGEVSSCLADIAPPGVGQWSQGEYPPPHQSAPVSNLSVNVFDLLTLLANWHSEDWPIDNNPPYAEYHRPGDIASNFSNGTWEPGWDGYIDVSDLLYLLTSWGPVHPCFVFDLENDYDSEEASIDMPANSTEIVSITVNRLPHPEHQLLHNSNAGSADDIPELVSLSSEVPSGLGVTFPNGNSCTPTISGGDSCEVDVRIIATSQVENAEILLEGTSDVYYQGGWPNPQTSIFINFGGSEPDGFEVFAEDVSVTSGTFKKVDIVVDATGSIGEVELSVGNIDEGIVVSDPDPLSCTPTAGNNFVCTSSVYILGQTVGENYTFDVYGQAGVGTESHTVSVDVAECDCELEPEFLCLIPDNLGDESSIEFGDPFGPSELTLQEIFDEEDSIDLNALADQKNYQIWGALEDSSITLSFDHIANYADNNTVFGFYHNSDPETFTPLFQIEGQVGSGGHTHYPDIEIIGPGGSWSGQVEVPPFARGEFTEKVGFAIDTQSPGGSGSQRFFSENTLNPGGERQAVVYSPDTGAYPNEYIIAWEDLSIAGGNSDEDFNDLVVRMTVDDCDPFDPETGNFNYDISDETVHIVPGTFKKATISVFSPEYTHIDPEDEDIYLTLDLENMPDELVVSDLLDEQGQPNNICEFEPIGGGQGYVCQRDVYVMAKENIGVPSTYIIDIHGISAGTGVEKSAELRVIVEECDCFSFSLPQPADWPINTNVDQQVTVEFGGNVVKPVELTRMEVEEGGIWIGYEFPVSLLGFNITPDGSCIPEGGESSCVITLSASPVAYRPNTFAGFFGGLFKDLLGYSDVFAQQNGIDARVCGEPVEGGDEECSEEFGIYLESSGGELECEVSPQQTGIGSSVEWKVTLDDDLVPEGDVTWSGDTHGQLDEGKNPAVVEYSTPGQYNVSVSVVGVGEESCPILTVDDGFFFEHL